MKNYFYIMLIIFFSISAKSFGWGPKGHKITAYIANSFLNYETVKKIDIILGGDKLQNIINLPDEYKFQNRSLKWIDQENTKDISWFNTFTWHFNSYKKDGKKRADQAITEAIDILKNNKNSLSLKKNALIMLVHIIGDVYQPLHLDLKNVPEGDNGANGLKVIFYDKLLSTNLHYVWDNLLIFQRYNYTEQQYARYLINKYYNMDLSHDEDWIHGTTDLSKNIYTSAENGDKLEDKYVDHYLPIVDIQLLKAGKRIAKTLNDIL